MSKVFNLKGSGKIGDIVQINAENTVKKSHTYPEFDFLQRINSSKKSIGMCSISDLDGNVYIVGQFEDTAFSNNILLNTETASKSGIFIAQLDKNGEWTWARKILEYEGPIYDGKRQKDGKIYLYSSLQICSCRMVQDLVRHGIVPNKSNILKRPNIDKEYYSHWIRGLFDGDGSVSLCKDGNTRGEFFGTKDVMEFVVENCAAILFCVLNVFIFF